MSKNRLLTLFGMLSAFGLMAQPTLTSGSMPVVGYSYSTREVDLGSTGPGNAGANQTWDFSALSDTGETTSFTVVNPSTLPDASTFPTANLGMVANLQDGSNYAIYLENTNSFMRGVGIGVTSSFGNFQIEYDDPMNYYIFPGTFNGQMEDTYHNSFSVDIAGFGTSTTSTTGFVSYEIDGYGTLINTSGTYQNTLRLKRYEVSYDTTESTFLGEPQEPSYSENHSLSYEWISVANGASIPLFVIRYDTTYTGGDFTVTVSGTHNYSNDPTGIEKANTSADFLLYPNPAQNSVLMTLIPGVERITISDLTGKSLENITPANQNGNLIQELNIAHLPAGAYLVQMHTQTGIATQKLIKQ